MDPKTGCIFLDTNSLKLLVCSFMSGYTEGTQPIISDRLFRK